MSLFYDCGVIFRPYNQNHLHYPHEYPEPRRIMNLFFAARCKFDRSITLGKGASTSK